MGIFWFFNAHLSESIQELVFELIDTHQYMLETETIGIRISPDKELDKELAVLKNQFCRGFSPAKRGD